jgi:hypothetical protein
VWSIDAGLIVWAMVTARIARLFVEPFKPLLKWRARELAWGRI